VQQHFPYVEKPAPEQLFRVGSEDLLARILLKETESCQAVLSLDQVAYLHDETATLSNAAMVWLLPSLSRHVLSNNASAERLSDSLVWYFDQGFSLFEFGWLKREQLTVLARVLEHLSERFGHTIVEALDNLQALKSAGSE